MRRSLPLFATALVALAVAGCGSSKSDSSTSGSSSTPSSTSTSTPAASPAPASGGAVAVKMQNIAFEPKNVTAKVGQKITWTNADSTDHNAVANKGASFKSKDFGKGGTYSYKLEKAGTISYECTIHPGMVGTITVTK